MAEEMGTEVNFNVNTVRHGEHKEPEKKTKSMEKIHAFCLFVAF